MKLGVIIGRFQPTHKGHIDNIFRKMIGECDKILVILGSAQESRTKKNPFSVIERKVMVKRSIADTFGSSVFQEKFHIVSCDDKPTLEEWKDEIKRLIADYQQELETESEAILYGYEKDDTSFYLKSFTNIKLVMCIVDLTKRIINATDVRKCILEEDCWSQTRSVTTGVWSYIKELIEDDHTIIEALKKEEE